MLEPSVEVIEKWKRSEFLPYLQSKKDELDLDSEDIEIFKKKKIAGYEFLELNVVKLMQYGLEPGAADRVVRFIKKIKGEEQGRYHDYF